MIEEILYKTIAVLMMFLGLYTIVWGYFFGRETDRMWKEYYDRKKRIDNATRTKIDIKPRVFDPGKWISSVKDKE